MDKYSIVVENKIGVCMFVKQFGCREEAVAALISLSEAHPELFSISIRKDETVTTITEKEM